MWLKLGNNFEGSKKREKSQAQQSVNSADVHRPFWHFPAHATWNIFNWDFLELTLLMSFIWQPKNKMIRAFCVRNQWIVCICWYLFLKGRKMHSYLYAFMMWRHFMNIFNFARVNEERECISTVLWYFLTQNLCWISVLSPMVLMSTSFRNHFDKNWAIAIALAYFSVLKAVSEYKKILQLRHPNLRPCYETKTFSEFKFNARFHSFRRPSLTLCKSGVSNQ